MFGRLSALKKQAPRDAGLGGAARGAGGLGKRLRCLNNAAAPDQFQQISGVRSVPAIPVGARSALRPPTPWA